MATRLTPRQSQGIEHFDLLPFIALMMIVLASLLFITMTVAAINVGAGAKEGWIPSGGADHRKKIPILVEWDGESLTIQNHLSDKTITIGKNPLHWWNSNEDFQNVELRRFLAEMISKKESHYVLFAVRPSGFGNFNVLALEFRDNDLNIGYEPVEQYKVVQLKLGKESTQ